jgi:TPR repeat protein
VTEAEELLARALRLEESLDPYAEDDEAAETVEQEVEDLLRAAAGHGLPKACAQLGAFLWHVREDEDEALPWLRKAADAGEAHAMALLGDIHDFLDDRTSAIEWYTRAAALGDEHAAGNLRAYGHSA